MTFSKRMTCDVILRHFTLTAVSVWREDVRYREKKIVFEDDWTERYAFILPKSSTKPFCLICNETVGVVKGGNVKRHYETKDRYFERQFPQNTEARTAKLRQLKSSYESTNKLLVRALTPQERATEASFRVAWVLSKNKKPFSDAEIVFSGDNRGFV